MKFLCVLVTCVIVIASGCQKSTEVDSLRGDLVRAQAQLAALEKQSSELNANVDELKAKVDELERLRTDFVVLKSRVETDRIQSRIEKVAWLTPADTGYDTVRFSLGALVMSIANIEPYANGSRVGLNIGNPLSATLTALQFKVDYGPVDKDGNPLNALMKTKDVSFTQPIKAGSWTRVQVILDGVPTEQLGYLRIHDVDSSTIELNRREVGQ